MRWLRHLSIYQQLSQFDLSVRENLAPSIWAPAVRARPQCGPPDA